VRLNELAPSPGSKKARKRVGRGAGSGHGKRSCRGNKGQKARNTVHPWFEGGQMPLQRRLPKRGFKNYMRTEYEVVNLGDLSERFTAGDEVTPESLAAKRLVARKTSKVKILANGELSFAVKVSAHAASARAKEMIEKAGGTLTLLK
jgi:large subunit ribosomal protein L15